MHLLRVSGLSPGSTVTAVSIAGLELTELWWGGEESLCGPASWAGAVSSSTTFALAIGGVTQKLLLSHRSTNMSSHTQLLGGSFFFSNGQARTNQLCFASPQLPVAGKSPFLLIFPFQIWQLCKLGDFPWQDARRTKVFTNFLGVTCSLLKKTELIIYLPLKSACQLHLCLCELR